jgi:nucleoid-associated protein YgaU
MTRETKIGLLVGLAFIIVIGILLSDHLTSSTEPPQAALANAGNTVRQGVTSPGSPAPAPAPVEPPVNTAPQNPVPTQSELVPGPDPVQIVKVGPGPAAPSVDGSDSTQAAAGNHADPQPGRKPESQQVEVAGADAPTVTKVPPVASASPIDQLARQHGEEVVMLDGNGRPARANVSPVNMSREVGAVNEYKAEPGDSLSRMASRLMGANTKANRDAIIAANPSLRDNPNKVIVGRTYIIPSAGAGDAKLANSTPAPAEPPAQVASQSGEYWYTVKEGDSLWRIAKEQLGRGSAVAAIKELNQDILTGENRDVVSVGMKIRLPGKPVARAN